MQTDLGRTFFAYASHPPLRAETMRHVIDGLNQRGNPAIGWESLKNDGRYLVDTITAEIDRASAVVAEISSMNPNVLFELGYAVAKNKPTWLAFDETDTEAERAWNNVAIFSTVGRSDYGGNAERLIARFQANPPTATQPLTETILANARPREANAVFAPSLPINLTPAERLERFLERQSHLKLLGSSEDLMIAPLTFYAKEIYRSSAAIIHLLSDRRKKAAEYNARASFLGGFAHGLELPILMVVESGYVSPLDFRDLLFQYSSSADLVDKVEHWLKSLPKVKGTDRRLGRLELDIELPIRSFGQYVAEYETDELQDYFIQTSEFTAVTSGEAQIFAGRKGTGKTATMSQVAKELALDRRVLVVPIKPSSYELSGLAEMVGRLGKEDNVEYLLMTIWIYLIQSEVSLRAAETVASRPLSINEEQNLESLLTLLDYMNINASDDLSTRLERVIAEAEQSVSTGSASDNVAIARSVRSEQLARLREVTRRVLADYDRVAILIDNLDKNWERGEGLDVAARFILALLVASGKIERELGTIRGGAAELETSLALFLRTDILDVVRTHAREPDKIGFRTVDWTDEQLLVRVLEERYAASSGRPRDSMWSELFCSEVRSLPTRDYFLWRALRRPRDFIYLANAALTTAINRGHSVIEASDITYAEKEYSRFAFEALVVESAAREFSLEEMLFEFAGVNSTLSSSSLEQILGDTYDSMRDWLVSASFLGVEVSEGRFEYVEGSVAARRKIRVAQRAGQASRRPMQLRVHPAFRPYLEIVDDDLHA